VIAHGDLRGTWVTGCEQYTEATSMWVNLFCTSAMVSPFSILNISYSSIRACFLAPLTSMVPSCVTSRISHISFTEAHCETLKNSSEFRVDVMMFLAIQSNWALLLSVSVHWDQGFSMKTSSFLNFGIKGPFTMASQIPQSIDFAKIFNLTFQNC